MTDATLYTVLALGTGAVARTLQADMSDHVNLMDFNPHGDGVTDDTTIVQAWLNRAAATNRAAYAPVPSVSYYLNSAAVTIPSNIKIYGDGPSSLFKLGPSLAISNLFPGGLYVGFINSTPVAGNSNIQIDGIAVNASNSPSNLAHCIHMRNVSRYSVKNCTFTGGNDAVSQTKSSNYTIENNWCVNQINGAIDSWDGCVDGVVIGNHVIGGGVLPYGILATGIAGDGTAQTIRRIKIIGNEVSDITAIGIWAQGGVDGSNVGTCLDCTIVGNTVLNSAGVGIRSSDGSGHTINGNVVDGAGTFGLHFTSETTGNTYDCVAIGNVIRNASSSGSGLNPAIAVHGTGSNNIIISSNRISGSNYYTGVELLATSYDNIVTNNAITRGTNGTYIGNYAGTNNYCIQIIGGTARQV